jgi:hypothetical protein
MQSEKEKFEEIQRINLNIKAVALYNSLILGLQQLEIPHKFERRTLATPPTPNEINKIRDFLEENMLNSRLKDEDEVRRIGGPIKAKIGAVYIEQMHLRPTGNEYVDQCLRIFEIQVERAIIDLEKHLLLNRPAGE